MSAQNPTPTEAAQALLRLRPGPSALSRQCACGQHYVPGTPGDGACPTCAFERTGAVSEVDVAVARGQGGKA